MEDAKNGKCLFCDRIWGVFGVGLGMLITLIGLDLLSGGFISHLVGKPVQGEVETELAEMADESPDE